MNHHRNLFVSSLLLSLLLTLGCSQIDKDLDTFGEAKVPELQTIITEVRGELQKRKAALATLEWELKRLGRTPSADLDYTRWQKTIAKLEEQLKVLLHEREEVYLAHKKFELSHGDADAMNLRIKEATTIATRTRAVYERSLVEFETGKKGEPRTE